MKKKIFILIMALILLASWLSLKSEKDLTRVTYTESSYPLASVNSLIYKKAILTTLPVKSELAEGAFMNLGRVSYFEGHVAAQMNIGDERVLSNGTLVKSTGEIIEKDGDRIFLKEGQLYYFE